MKSFIVKNLLFAAENFYINSSFRFSDKLIKRFYEIQSQNDKIRSTKTLKLSKRLNMFKTFQKKIKLNGWPCFLLGLAFKRMNWNIFLLTLSDQVTYLQNMFTCVDCFLENGSFIRLLEKGRGQVINIIDVDDNRRLRLIDPIMPNQAQLVLQGKQKKHANKTKT